MIAIAATATSVSSNSPEIAPSARDATQRDHDGLVDVPQELGVVLRCLERGSHFDAHAWIFGESGDDGPHDRGQTLLIGPLHGRGLLDCDPAAINEVVQVELDKVFLA